jgi:hypothetical protein
MLDHGHLKKAMDEKPDGYVNVIVEQLKQFSDHLYEKNNLYHVVVCKKKRPENGRRGKKGKPILLLYGIYINPIPKTAVWNFPYQRRFLEN